MNTTLFLHVGMHKTASTSIQHTAYANRKILRKHGFLYLKNWRVNHNFLYGIFTKDPSSFYEHIFHNRTPEEINLYNEEMKNIFIDEIKHLNKVNNIIVSAEDLSVLEEDGLKRLKLFFNNTIQNCNIKIIMYTRNPLEYAASDIQQRIKTGYDYNINAYKDLFEKRLKNFINVFGFENLIVKKFEDAIKHQYGPAGYFFNLLNIEDSIIEEMKIINLNESLSDLSIDLIYFINQKVPIIINQKLSEGRYHGDTKSIQEIKGDKYILSNEEVLEIKKFTTDDIFWLKNTFRIDYSNVFYKTRPKKELNFSEEYVNDFMMIFSDLSPLIKKLTLEYFIDKSRENNNSDSKKNIERLIAFVKGELYMNLSRVYIGTHIPKTAGTSLIKHVENGMDSRHYHIVTSLAQNAKREIPFLEEQHNLEEYKFIFGHHVDERTLINFKNKEIFLFTFLREPVSRLVSHFFYSQKLRRKQGREVQNFADFYIHTPKNAMCSWLIKRFPSAINPNAQTPFEKARSILETFNFVASAEDFNEKLPLLMDEIGGFSNQFAPKSNVINYDQSRKQAILNRFEERILKEHSYDIQLYEAYSNNASQLNPFGFNQLARDSFLDLLFSCKYNKKQRLRQLFKKAYHEYCNNGMENNQIEWLIENLTINTLKLKTFSEEEGFTLRNQDSKKLQKLLDSIQGILAN